MKRSLGQGRRHQLKPLGEGHDEDYDPARGQVATILYRKRNSVWAVPDSQNGAWGRVVPDLQALRGKEEDDGYLVG